MKPLACQYSLVQFVPHFETGEFANVGVVLACPQTGYFHFLLQDKKWKRVTGFFSAVDRTYYIRAVKTIELELSRVQAQLHLAPPQARAEAIRAQLARLTSPREAIIRFDRTRVLLTEDPEAELHKKYEHFVEHSFVTPEYVEQTMNARLRGLLTNLALEVPFRDARIGDDTLNARFDFVQTLDGQHRKIIKALNLSQNDANDIAAHGDIWAGKIERLRKRNELPQDVLFNVALPEPDSARFAISRDIVHKLEGLNVTVVPDNDDFAARRIERFAQTPL